MHDLLTAAICGHSRALPGDIALGCAIEIRGPGPTRLAPFCFEHEGLPAVRLIDGFNESLCPFVHNQAGIRLVFPTGSVVLA